MRLELGPDNLPDLLAGLGMLAIATLLLWVAPRDRVHRAFALLQAVAGGGSLVFVAATGFEGTDPFLAAVWRSVGVYFMLALPFAAGFFALRLLVHDGERARSKVVAWALLLGLAVLLAAYALDHDLARSRRADGGVVLGPFAIAFFQGAPVYAAIALLFALGARGAPSETRREGLVIATSSFALLASYWVAFGASVQLFAPAWMFHGAIAPAALRLVVLSLHWLGLALLAVVFLVLFARPALHADDATRRSRRLFACGAALAASSGAVVTVLLRMDEGRFATLPYTFDGVWRVVATLVLAYALLKRQVFDAQVKLRLAISRSTLAAAFVATFFVASEGAQILFGQGNQWVGLFAAGALVFALAPLQRAAERLAERAVPPSHASAEGGRGVSMADDEYRNAVRLALRDRVFTREEERHLIRLAHRAGIPPARAMEIHDEVERERRGGGGSRVGAETDATQKEVG